MRTIGRLVVAYLLAGIAIAVIDNLMAHTRAASSIFDIVSSSVPTAEKIAAFYDLVLWPIVAWPVRVMAILRGGA